MRSRALERAFAVVATLAVTGCYTQPLDAPCAGACPVSECVNGQCLRTRTPIDMSVDVRPDDVPIIDMRPPPREAGVDMAEPDASPPPLDAAPMPDTMVAPDATVDAGCAPAEEICNGIDDDCDGATDEGELAPGAACDTGFPGPCRAGRFLCQDGPADCLPTVVPAGDDICDVIDNDCDGATDEDGPLVGGNCRTDGAGRCALGRVECGGAGEYTCAALFTPEDETCNDQDDDCDGATDESYPELATACEADAPGACLIGQILCQEGALVCVSWGEVA